MNADTRREIRGFKKSGLIQKIDLMFHKMRVHFGVHLRAQREIAILDYTFFRTCQLFQSSQLPHSMATTISRPPIVNEIRARAWSYCIIPSLVSSTSQPPSSDCGAEGVLLPQEGADPDHHCRDDWDGLERLLKE